MFCSFYLHIFWFVYKINKQDKVNRDKQIHKHANRSKSKARLAQEKVILYEWYTRYNLLFFVLDVNVECYSLSIIVYNQVEMTYRTEHIRLIELNTYEEGSGSCWSCFSSSSETIVCMLNKFNYYTYDLNYLICNCLIQNSQRCKNWRQQFWSHCHPRLDQTTSVQIGDDMLED